MKDQKSILNYGFLLFLVIVGVLSFFKTDTGFANAINSLSFPIFLFTVSTLMVKCNKFIKDYFEKAVVQQNKIVELLQEQIILRKQLIAQKEERNEDVAEDKIMITNRIGQSINNIALSMALQKYTATMNAITKIINFGATLSFAFCLLSLVGVISPLNNSNWINIFSLMLVFFDFFIFDGIMETICVKVHARICKKADKKAKSDIEQVKS